MAQSLYDLANVYDNQGKYDEALLLYQRSLTIREKVLGSEHPDTAESLNNLANLYHEQGMCADALPLHQKAVAICEKVLGSEHPETVLYRQNLDITSKQLGLQSEDLAPAKPQKRKRLSTEPRNDNGESSKPRTQKSKGRKTK